MSKEYRDMDAPTKVLLWTLLLFIAGVAGLGLAWLAMLVF